VSGGYPSLPPFFVASLQDPALLAERLRMPGSGGESRSDMAILTRDESLLHGFDHLRRR
jgi:hypothetical protein